MFSLMDTLTVIVPVYNVEKYLDRCISSIVHQTYPYVKVLIVDDGSTDSSGSIADKWAVQHPNIFVVHQSNQGLSGARNTGILKADTRYIGFIDSDDYIDPMMYEMLIRGMKEKKARIGFCGVWEEQENGNKRSVYKPGIEKTFDTVSALLELNHLNYYNMSVCKGCYERAIFFEEKYGDKVVLFPVGRICEDYYIIHKLIARTERVYYTSTPYYHYVSRKGSISRNSLVSLAPIEAGRERVDFYDKWFHDLTYSAKTQFVISVLTVRNQFISRRQEIPQEIDEQMKIDIRNNIEYLLKNPYVTVKRKIITLAMWKAPKTYHFVKRLVRGIPLLLRGTGHDS